MPDEKPSKESEKTLLMLKAEMDRLVDDARGISTRAMSPEGFQQERLTETVVRAVCWVCQPCGHTEYFTTAPTAAEIGSCPKCQATAWKTIG